MAFEWNSRGGGLEALSKAGDSLTTSSRGLTDTFRNVADSIAKNGETIYNTLYQRNKEEYDLFKSKITNDITKKILTARTYEEKQYAFLNAQNLEHADFATISKIYLESVPNDYAKATADIALKVKEMESKIKEFELLNTPNKYRMEIEAHNAELDLKTSQTAYYYHQANKPYSTGHGKKSSDNSSWISIVSGDNKDTGGVQQPEPERQTTESTDKEPKIKGTDVNGLTLKGLPLTYTKNPQPQGKEPKKAEQSGDDINSVLEDQLEVE